jgi:hypothetical protein
MWPWVRESARDVRFRALIGVVVALAACSASHPDKTPVRSSATTATAHETDTRAGQNPPTSVTTPPGARPDRSTTSVATANEPNDTTKSSHAPGASGASTTGPVTTTSAASVKPPPTAHPVP